MGIIVDEDFENWNENGWVENTNGAGVLTVPCAPAKYAGTYGCRGELPNTAPRHTASINLTWSNNTDPIYVDFRFKITASELSADKMIILLLDSDVGINGWFYIKESSGIHFIRFSTGFNDYEFSANPLTIGVWYRIRLKFLADQVNGIIYLMLDETLLLDYEGKTAWVGEDDPNNEIWIGPDNLWTTGNFAFDLDWDDVYISTTTFRGGTLRKTHIIEIRGDQKRFLRLHYIKNHPSPHPDIFDMRMVAENADDINYWDIIDIRKDGVTEFVGFVEEKTPVIGEDGLEFIISGRCWKVVAWKKQTERFIETREVGPAGEAGFFGKVYPRELIMFLLRTPFSVHPAGKVRHKIGWGIPSDAWVATANRTNSGFYPAWAICRHIGFAWQNGTPAASEQQLGDYYQIDMGQEYSAVTAILIESRDDITETQYARNFEIQLSKDGVNWTTVRSFDGYGARDILASWAPVNNVRYIRIYITLTRTDLPNWEISQVYIWQACDVKYRLLNETETDL